MIKSEKLELKMMQLPIYATCDWCKYKNEIYFATINYERSIKSNRIMIDLSYCATKALNNIVLKTVRYDKNKFTPTDKFNGNYIFIKPNS